MIEIFMFFPLAYKYDKLSYIVLFSNIETNMHFWGQTHLIIKVL